MSAANLRQDLTERGVFRAQDTIKALRAQLRDAREMIVNMQAAHEDAEATFTTRIATTQRRADADDASAALVEASAEKRSRALERQLLALTAKHEKSLVTMRRQRDAATAEAVALRSQLCAMEGSGRLSDVCCVLELDPVPGYSMDSVGSSLTESMIESPTAQRVIRGIMETVVKGIMESVCVRVTVQGVCAWHCSCGACSHLS